MNKWNKALKMPIILEESLKKRATLTGNTSTMSDIISHQANTQTTKAECHHKQNMQDISAVLHH